MVSKCEIVLKMQSVVEDFDFEQCYGTEMPKKVPDNSSKKQVLLHKHDEYYGMISASSKIYERKYKQYNYSVAYYSKFDKVINPKLMLRFDCRQINDI